MPNLTKLKTSNNLRFASPDERPPRKQLANQELSAGKELARIRQLSNAELERDAQATSKNAKIANTITAVILVLSVGAFAVIKQQLDQQVSLSATASKAAQTPAPSSPVAASKSEQIGALTAIATARSEAESRARAEAGVGAGAGARAEAASEAYSQKTRTIHRLPATTKELSTNRQLESPTRSRISYTAERSRAENATKSSMNYNHRQSDHSSLSRLALAANTTTALAVSVAVTERATGANIGKAASEELDTNSAPLDASGFFQQNSQLQKFSQGITAQEANEEARQAFAQLRKHH